jgi:SAM-dependent methyltransferase
MQMMKRILKSMLPYELLQLIRDIKFRRSLETLDTIENLQKRVQELEHKYGFVGLHMGCGPLRYEGYLNCDLSGGEYCVDATRPLPILDNSLDYVYSEHFIEHVAFDEALFFLKESLRVLKKGGICRCLFPDFSSLLLAADKEKELEAKLRDRITGGIVSRNGECLMNPRVSAEQAELWDARDDICNNFFRDWGHKYLWSARHLQKTLEYIGFQKVEIAPFGESNYPKVLLDSTGRWGWEWTSAVEAHK